LKKACYCQLNKKVVLLEVAIVRVVPNKVQVPYSEYCYTNIINVAQKL